LCTYLAQHHGGDLLRRKNLVLAEILDLHLRVVLVVNDLEWPGLDILLDGGVVKSSPNETPERVLDTIPCTSLYLLLTHLTSKTVLAGFIAAWFFAASPINRSSEVKETKDGVVKLPCSLATGYSYQHAVLPSISRAVKLTDLNTSALIVGHTRVGGT